MMEPSLTSLKENEKPSSMRRKVMAGIPRVSTEQVVQTWEQVGLTKSGETQTIYTTVKYVTIWTCFWILQSIPLICSSVSRFTWICKKSFPIPMYFTFFIILEFQILRFLLEVMIYWFISIELAFVSLPRQRKWLVFPYIWGYLSFCNFFHLFYFIKILF